MIIKVAHIIEAEVRTSDIVARFGGEEFVMLLQDCDLDNAYKVAEKVRQDIEKTSVSVHIDTEVKFTVSIGVAQFNQKDDNNNIELTLSRADEALYKAKNTGRNKTVVSN